MVMGLFAGGGSEPEASPNHGTNAVAPPAEGAYPRSVAPQCTEYSRLFVQCMEQNGNQLSTCQDYMDMMKACQQQHAQ